GFVRSPSPTTLSIAALPQLIDPSHSNFAAGRRIGVLGVDLSTRRRNRANGVIREVTAEGLLIEVQESFGNCPQYIQRRTVETAIRPSSTAFSFKEMSAATVDLISRSDTFFIGTKARVDLNKGGLDISHRGGKPGFVRVAGRRLSIPDFRG